MTDKEPQVWTYPVYYLGGYSKSQRHRNGTLSIISGPEKKLFFDSYSLKMNIPLAKIQNALLNTEKFIDHNVFMFVGLLPAFIAGEYEKVLTISFEDASGIEQKPRFQFIVKDKEEYDILPEQAITQINSLIPKTNKISNSQEPLLNPQDLPGYFCKYCGVKNDADAIWCQSCGLRIKPEPLSEIVCPVCGTKSGIQAKFCKKCGNKLETK